MITRQEVILKRSGMVKHCRFLTYQLLMINYNLLHGILFGQGGKSESIKEHRKTNDQFRNAFKQVEYHLLRYSDTIGIMQSSSEVTFKKAGFSKK